MRSIIPAAPAVAMTRTEGWESRLAAAVNTVRGWPYVLGQTDCIAMACLFIREMTGVDYWPRWAGQYRDMGGALKHIIRMADHEQPYLTHAVSNVFGFDPVPALLAQRGDVVEWDEADGPHLGVLLHTEAIGFGPNGVYFVPASQCLHAWKVG